ncbi:MAG TPA: cell division protein FtsQ/DivIB [Gammaproteobacteria bacterium]|nr:cell division protein FtsQ/DivIB [Gammaproteobacteria bacterium]
MNSQVMNEQLPAGYNRSGGGRFYELLVALLVTAMLVWFGYYLLDPTTLPIRQVRVEGEFRHLSTTGLQDLVRNRVRGGFFNINVKAVRDAVLIEPWVKSVSVHRVWPDGLQVFVKEQIAAARWRDSALLNRNGELFTPDKDTFPDGLPLLSGPEGTHSLVMDRYLFLEEQMSRVGLSVRQLYMDDRRAWSLELGNGLSVVLGRKEFKQRVTRFVEVIPARFGEKLDEAVKIDMRYTNGFAVRWKKELPDNSLAAGA